MKRLALLDFLRAVALLNMIAFHACYDLYVVSGSFTAWQLLPGVQLWQQAIVLSFIFISGMSFAVRRQQALGQKHKALLQGLWLLLLGQFITWTTLYFMPQEAIYYGVITFLGSALLGTLLLENSRWQLLSRLPAELGALLSLALFAFTYHVQLGFFGFRVYPYELPLWLYKENHAFWGFPADDFLSADYVSFLPHIFMYWLGLYAYRLLEQRAPQLLHCSPWQRLGCLGRHSLGLYFVHQPVLLGVLWLCGVVK